MNKIGCTFAVVLASYNKNRQPTVFGGSGRKILTLADCRRQVKICPPCVWLTITSEVIDYVVDATNRRRTKMFTLADWRRQVKTAPPPRLVITWELLDDVVDATTLRRKVRSKAETLAREL